MSFSDTYDTGSLAVWEYPLPTLYAELYSNMEETGFVNNSSEGMRKVREEDFVFFGETSMARWEAAMHCDVQIVGNEFSARPYAIAVRKGSPLAGPISAT